MRECLVPDVARVEVERNFTKEETVYKQVSGQHPVNLHVSLLIEELGCLN